MPFTGPVFANVSGASNATPGAIIQSAVWNNIFIDYSDAFTQVMEQLVSTISNRNICWMNGGFEVWQRGAGASASIAVSAGTTSYTADRWYITTGANQASTISAQTGLSNSSQLSCRIQRNNAQTGTTAMAFGYPLDTPEIIRMRGNIVTLSLLVSAGANWSPTNGTLQVFLYSGTGASPAKVGGGYTGQTTVLTASINLIAGGSTVALSATSSAVFPINATQADLVFVWTPTGVAGANDWFQIDDLQIENNLSSDVWTPMNYDRIPFEIMLKGCKKYYNKTFPYSTAPAAGTGFSSSLQTISQAAEKIGIYWQYGTPLREGTPTFSKFCPATATSSNWAALAGTTVSASVESVSNVTAQNGIFIFSNASAANGTTYGIHMTVDAGI